MPENQLTLRIDTPVGDGNVRLSDFVNELQALRDALRATDVVVSGGEVAAEWDIAALSKASPAAVVLEARPVSPGRINDFRGGEIVSRFIGYIRTLAAGDVPPAELDRGALLAFKSLATPVRQGLLTIAIENTTQSVTVTEAVEQTIDATLAPTQVVFGSVKGRLEFINIHGRRNVFRVFPVIGPERINCSFPSELLSQAREAVGSNVRVHGRVKYLSRDPFPSSVVVSEIERIPDDSNLPSLYDVRGMAPDATGDLSSEEFVREVRRGW